MIETLKAWGLVRARSACDEGRLVATAAIRDQPAAMMQAQLTPRLIQQRLREAFAVEQRLPDSGRPRGLVSFWPAAPSALVH